MKREKIYTDYSYVTAHELKRILNLSEEGVQFVLSSGHVLGTVISKRTKYILGHVRKAQDQIAQQQNERLLEITQKIRRGAGKSKYGKAQ